MDFPESTKLVYNRIQNLEPEIASKIIGYLMLQGNGEREMIRFAFGPDTLIHSLINKAKVELGLSPQMNKARVSDIPFHLDSLSPVSARPRLFQHTAVDPIPYWDPQLPVDNRHQTLPNPDLVAEEFHLRNQLQFLGLEDPIKPVGLDFSRDYQRSPSMPEFPVKICHYFNKGFCKNGSNCKYFHGVLSENFPRNVFSPHSNELHNEEHAAYPGSLERLGTEITELLRSRRGFPISIASLPRMYYEKYGRSLQAEGYLTESQRHGNTGFSLTKLLARLKNSVRLIDRPHGQHSIILVEDAPRYLEYYAGELSEHVGVISGARQIYLTFPAESTFSELDVSNYFNKFGPVQDVRIPCQQKRMFGFVTFVYPETVRHILSKGNPHFVCDARVLVKPYREKSRLVDRKFSNKLMQPMCPHFIDRDFEFSSVPPRAFNKSRFRKNITLGNDQAFELERRCYSEMNLTTSRMTLSHRPFFSYSMSELKLPSEENSEQYELPSAEHFDYLLDVLNNTSTSEDEKLTNISTDCNNQDSEGLNLPESPFTSATGNDISTLT